MAKTTPFRLARPIPARRIESGTETPAAMLRRIRFHVLGFWRALHPIPLNAPLPRPTHDF